MTLLTPGLSLSGKETSAMTFYELDTPQRPVFSGLFTRIGQGFGNAVRSMQYARMIHALSELSDENLATIGLARTDISRHARECVYGTDG